MDKSWSENWWKISDKSIDWMCWKMVENWWRLAIKSGSKLMDNVQKQVEKIIKICLKKRSKNV
jgi:hypothetical protein